MSDDRPLSSEEMIKRAREQLDDRPDVTHLTGTDEEQRRRIEAMAEEETPSLEKVIAAPRTTPRRERRVDRPRRERRVARPRRAPPQGFGEVPPQSRVAVVIGLALALLGLAVAALVAFASATP